MTVAKKIIAPASPFYENLNGNASLEAIQNGFELFRQDDRIINMLEHVNIEQAHCYWQRLEAEFGALIDKIDWPSLRQLDKVGGPKLVDFPNIAAYVQLPDYKFSCNLFRYLYTGCCMLSKLAGKVRILEIGGGYGGQAKALFALAPVFQVEIMSYTLIDLASVGPLQTRFARETGVPMDRFKCCAFEDLCAKNFVQLDQHYDFGFSNFAFSEINRKIQDIYAVHVLPRCASLYMIWNTEHVHPNLSSLQVFPENPKTGPHNRILFGTAQRIHFHDSNFAHMPVAELKLWSDKPDLLKFSRQCQPGIAVFTDRCVDQVSSCIAQRKVAWLCEPRELNADHYNWVAKNFNLFDEVWSHELCFPLARWILHSSYWISDQDQKIYSKSKNISFIASDKNTTTGHRLRQVVRERLPPTVDRFGGKDGHIDSKLIALAPYRFSITIENVNVETFFTEKLLDCFLTGTVPVYWGPVCKQFDESGFIRFETTEQLLALLPSLTEELYLQMLPAVQRNFQLCRSGLGLQI